MSSMHLPEQIKELQQMSNTCYQKTRAKYVPHISMQILTCTSMHACAPPQTHLPLQKSKQTHRCLNSTLAHRQTVAIPHRQNVVVPHRSTILRGGLRKRGRPPKEHNVHVLGMPLVVDASTPTDEHTQEQQLFQQEQQQLMREKEKLEEKRLLHQAVEQMQQQHMKQSEEDTEDAQRDQHRQEVQLHSQQLKNHHALAITAAPEMQTESRTCLQESPACPSATHPQRTPAISHFVSTSNVATASNQATTANAASQSTDATNADIHICSATAHVHTYAANATLIATSTAVDSCAPTSTNTAQGNANILSSATALTFSGITATVDSPISSRVSTQGLLGVMAASDRGGGGEIDASAPSTAADFHVHAVGTEVQGRYASDGKWYAAKIAKVLEEGYYLLDWADGDDADIHKSHADVRRLQGGVELVGCGGGGKEGAANERQKEEREVQNRKNWENGKETWWGEGDVKDGPRRGVGKSLVAMAVESVSAATAMGERI